MHRVSLALVLLVSRSFRPPRPAAPAARVHRRPRDGANASAVAAEHAQVRCQRRLRLLARPEGLLGVLTAGALDALSADSRVASSSPTRPSASNTTQTGATWGIDRIDQRALPLSTTYTYTATGAGVTAYVIDTGIRKTHTQFGGRAVHGADTTTPLGLTSDDCHGHGTHVAGTIGGSTYGVAKSVAPRRRARARLRRLRH